MCLAATVSRSRRRRQRWSGRATSSAALPPPIPDRFRDMRAEDVGAARQIGDRPRHAQDAMHGPCRELQQVDRVFEHRLILRRESAHRVRLRLIQMRVAASGTLSLHLARTDHTCAYHIAGFTRRCVGAQFRWRESRNFEVQVDAFEQRAGDAAAVARDRIGMAAAATGGIAGPAAGA